MHKHDIIVIGASAGGVDALKLILAALPKNLAASVLIVTHIPSERGWSLAPRLDANCALPVRQAEDGETIATGHVYIAPPDRHLLVSGTQIRLGCGPRENMARPSIDPLFRSAAIAFGPRVIGVILSGMLNDGASGLEAVKRCGGIAVVQDPQDAGADEMPNNALRATHVDHVAPAGAIGPLIAGLVEQPAAPGGPAPPDICLEVEIAAGGRSDSARLRAIGDPSPLTCPSCCGVLTEVRGSRPLRYRCQTGHGYTAKLLEQTQERAVDEALRIALRVIEERAELVSRMARDAARSRRPGAAGMYRARAEEYRAHADTVRRALIFESPLSGGERGKTAN